jgi:hypothetical protein
MISCKTNRIVVALKEIIYNPTFIKFIKCYEWK